MSADRQKRLQHLHGMLVQLIIHEGRCISERTNNFLLFNSFFFGGFLLLMTQLQEQSGWSIGASLVITTIGLLFSLFQFLIIGQNIAVVDFWRSTLGLIERDTDFWWPSKTENDTDFDFYGARLRSHKGEETRQGQNPLRVGGIPIENKHVRRLFEPYTVFGTWLPIIIGLLWLFAFIWTLGAIN